MSVEAIYKNYLQKLSMKERLELIKILIDTIPSRAQNQKEKRKFKVMDFAGNRKSRCH